MNNNGVPLITSSEIQPSDQVITSAATCKAVRPNRPPLTPPTGLTKATPEPPGPSSSKIPQTTPNPTLYELFNYEPMTTTATLKPNEKKKNKLRLLRQVHVFLTLLLISLFACSFELHVTILFATHPF